MSRARYWEKRGLLSQKGQLPSPKADSFAPTTMIQFVQQSQQAPNEPVALLLFSRSAAAEARYKRLAPGRHNKRVLGAMIQHARKKAERSGLPFFHCTEREQQGGSFGEKLSNALQNLWARGYEQVIVLGNDSPNLSSAKLQDLAGPGGRAGLHLGPDKRGGIYFISIRREAFHARTFEQLAWNTSRLQQDLQGYADERALNLRWDQEAGDINEARDLQYFAMHFGEHPLSVLLRRLSQPQNLLSIPLSLSLNKREIALGIGMRAPPICR